MITWPKDPRTARVAWSRIVEPGDSIAGAFIAELGPVEALAALQDWTRLGRVVLPDRLSVSPDRSRLERHISRWLSRVANVDPWADLAEIRRLGGSVLVPGDDGWPSSVDALGCEAPICLWVRGLEAESLADTLTRSAAVVGARAATAYGERIAAEFGAGLADRGVTVVSGGAYGIDAAAHRGAVTSTHRAATIAVLAGGVDRLYPAGNTRLLERIVRVGAVIAEAPPGAVPTRNRFLTRNRLIAALSQGTVVVEAAWRSGAINTAGWAAQLLRPVGAVPGPVTSAASAGCHRLIRSQHAICVCDVAEVLDLVGDVGTDAAEEERGRPAHLLTPTDQAVLDGVRPHRPIDVDGLAHTAFRTTDEVLSALGRLEARGLVNRVGGGWTRTINEPKRGT